MIGQQSGEMHNMVERSMKSDVWLRYKFCENLERYSLSCIKKTELKLFVYNLQTPVQPTNPCLLWTKANHRSA